MAAADLDILVLGRQANVRYVTGAPQLWVAGTRPFGPACVLVRATGAIHLLSTWDEGVPDDIPHENLYGISWNPMNTIAALQRIDGAGTARRVGTDEDMAGVAIYLASRAGDYVVGATITVDGGIAFANAGIRAA